MVTARLIDNIWAIREAGALNSCKLMLVQAIGGARAEEQLVVVDTTSAGIGSRVMIITDSSACRILKDDGTPVDVVVVRIIDEDYTFDIGYA